MPQMHADVQLYFTNTNTSLYGLFVKLILSGSELNMTCSKRPIQTYLLLEKSTTKSSA